MTFKEILDTDIIRLPIMQHDESSFIEQLIYALQNVESMVLESDDLSSEENFDEDHFKETFSRLVNGLLDTLFAYLDGLPNHAFEIFRSTLNNTNVMAYMNPTMDFPIGSSFYRARKVIGNENLSKGALFHVPYEQRKKIGTQRYSIPGFPTLYLSSSIYVAWEELGRPNFNELSAVRLESKTRVRCFDLRMDRYSKKYNYDWEPGLATTEERDDMYAMMSWPLIAACSYKVLDKDLPFKPEYIIPQLMLQLLQENQDIYGVIFSSTHIDMSNENTSGTMYNIAIPVRQRGVHGYCPDLLEMFQSTEVLASQVVDLSSGNGQMWSPHEEVEKNTQTIELIKGIGTQYPSTKFGRMESTLLHMEVGPID